VRQASHELCKEPQVLIICESAAINYKLNRNCAEITALLGDALFKILFMAETRPENPHGGE
jgi:hypothetical protein